MTMLQPALARGFLNVFKNPTRTLAAVLGTGASELSEAICPRTDASAPLKWTAPFMSLSSLARQPNDFPCARLNLQPQPTLQLNFLRKATAAAARLSESSLSAVAKNEATGTAIVRTASTTSAQKRPAAAKAKGVGAGTKATTSTRKKPTAAKGKAASAKKATPPRRAAGKTTRTQNTKTTTSRVSTRLARAAKKRAKQRAKEARARARAKKREAKAREAVKKARARAKAKEQRKKDAERRKKAAGRARAMAKEATRIKRAPSALNFYIGDQAAGKSFDGKRPPLKDLTQRFRELPEADKKKYEDMAAQAKAEVTKRRKERAEAWAAKHAILPYNLFYKETFAEFSAANPNLLPKEVAKLCAERWRALPAEGRKKYIDASEADRRAKGLPPAATAAAGAATAVAKV